jgi:hypothetical protein
VAGDELRRVLEHVDEAVQLAQDVVRDVARGARLAVQEDRDVGVAAADFLTKARRLAPSGSALAVSEVFVVDRQDEGRGAALLLGKGGQVAVAGDAQHLEAFLLDRLRPARGCRARGVLRTEVLVDDDDREMESAWPIQYEIKSG